MIRRMISTIKNRKKKERSKLYRYTNRTLATIGFAYILLLFFPNPLFAYSARVGQFNFHSDRPIPSEIRTVVERATEKLATSPLYTTNESFDVFIAADQWRRTLLMPRSPGASGASYILTGNTVLNRCDIKGDICTNDQPKFNRRPMHAVLAHECMHQLMAKELGLIAYARLPTWKNEGYCEYVAGSPSFDSAQGEKLLREEKTNSSHAFRYFTYMIAVRSCIDEKGMKPRQLLSQHFDFQVVLDESMK